MLGVLRQPSFALLWTGGLVSMGGDWALNAALPFFVYERTGSTVATAGMIAAELTPGILVGPLAGVLVDRYDRRRLLIAANVLQAATVAGLLVVSSGGRLWIVYAVAAAQSVLSSFSQPAEAALLPSLVGERELVAANALNALNNRLGRLLGVPLGGVLLGMAGLSAVVVVDVASFAAAAGLVALVEAPRREGVPRAGIGAEWLDGMRLVRDDRKVAMLFWILGLMTFGGTMLDPLYVAWVRDVLGQGPSVYGLLLTTHAVAGIVGSLVVARHREHLPPRVLMGWGSLLAGLALVLKFDLPFVALTFALTVVGGVTSVASSIGIETWAQQSVRDAYRGRVFAALGASGALFSLAGAMAGGVAARWAGTTVMLNVAAVLVTAAGVVVFRALRPDVSHPPLRETTRTTIAEGS